MVKEDHPGVAFHPPFLVIGLLIAGWTMSEAIPVPLLPEVARRPLGYALAAASFGLFSWAVTVLLRAGTNVPTHLPSLALVRHGPYRFTRNPIYLSMAIGYAALAVLLNSAWFLFVDVLFVGLISAGVIVREERYLTRKFGAEYEAYRRDVRRWL